MKEAIELYRKAIPYWNELHSKRGEATSYNNIGEMYRRQHLFDSALAYFNKALAMRTELNIKTDIATTYNNLGLVYDSKGEFAKALDYYLKSVSMHEGSNNLEAMANSYMNLGFFLTDRGQYDEATKYFNKSIEIRTQLKDRLGLSAVYVNFGRLYSLKHELKKGEDYFLKALAINQEIGTPADVSACLVNLGLVYFEDKDQHDKALDYFDQAYKLSESVNDIGSMAGILSNMAFICTMQKNYSRSLIYLEKSLPLAKQSGIVELLMGTYSSLVELHDSLRDYKKAFLYHKLLGQLKDSIYTVESTTQMAKMQSLFDSERKTKEIALLTKDNENKIALAKEESKKKTVITVSSIIIVLLISFLALFVMNRLKITRQQKKVIESQKELVEEKQKEMLDSINYARRIQKAHLPTEKYIAKNIDRLKQ